jgi:hypothetical protein
MAIKTAESFADDGHSPQEIADGIDRLRDYATWGHALGEYAVAEVGRSVVGDRASYLNRRVVSPTGHIAVRSSIMPIIYHEPPSVGQNPPKPGPDYYHG